MAVGPLILAPPPSPPARSAFHQRIKANTEAILSLARVTEDAAQSIEPRVTALEQALPVVRDDLNRVGAAMAELESTRVRQEAIEHLNHRLQQLEHLAHEVKQLGHSLNTRIDDTARQLRDRIGAVQAVTERRIEDLAGRVTALDAGEELRPGWRDVALYATATNGDGSFDGRTELGKLFLDQTIKGSGALTGVSAVAALLRPRGRAAFVRTMSAAFAELPERRRAHIGVLTEADWGGLFDCAPELARFFDERHASPPAS